MNQTLKVYTFPSGQSLQIAQGDVTAETVGAIVNAANSYLCFSSFINRRLWFSQIACCAGDPFHHPGLSGSKPSI